MKRSRCPQSARLRTILALCVLSAWWVTCGGCGRRSDLQTRAPAIQARAASRPDLTDPDGDGLLSFEERALGTDPERADTDGDGLRDIIEVQAQLDPLSRTTFEDGQEDGAADLDGDGWSNLQEQDAGSNVANSQSIPGRLAEDDPSARFGGSVSWREVHL